MDAWLIIVVVLLFVLLLVGLGFAIFYCPNYQKNNNSHPKPKGLPYIMATRAQVGDDVLPAIPIQDTPTLIELNLSVCDSKFVKVTRSGLYTISYGVDLNFASPATASVSVRRRSCKPNSGFEIIDGSVRQVAVNNGMLFPINNTFLAQLTAGDQLQLSAISTSIGNQLDIVAVSVPASNANYLQSPETLASLTLTIVP